MTDKNALRACPPPRGASATQQPEAGESARCCVDCGAVIPDGRLEAIPEATRCWDCQTDIERSGKWDWGMSE